MAIYLHKSTCDCYIHHVTQWFSFLSLDSALFIVITDKRHVGSKSFKGHGNFKCKSKYHNIKVKRFRERIVYNIHLCTLKKRFA